MGEQSYMRAVTLLGSTGSIGVSTLDILRRRPDRFQAYALVAGRNAELLATQIVEFRPKVAVVETDEIRNSLIQALRTQGLPETKWPELECGARARVNVATAGECDFVLSAIVGVAGLEATYEAVRARKRIGLANKEVLVASGELVMAAA